MSDDGLIQRTMRVHSIEHATIAVLFERRGQRGTVAALSDPWGFVMLSGYDADEVESAAREALRRLCDGRHDLAITELCGSNIVVTGLLTATAALAVARGKWRNYPSAVSAAALAGIASKPIGRWVQQNLTTATDGMHALNVGSVRQIPIGGRSLTRVTITGR